MSVNKLLIRKSGNRRRITARLATVTSIGKQSATKFNFFNGIGIGINALHLVKDNALITYVAVFVKFVMPALLIKNLGSGINSRIKHGVQIHIHKVKEILIVL